MRNRVLGVTVGVVLGLILAGWLIAWSVGNWFTAKDQAHFDQVEAELTDHRATYNAVTVRMRELIASAPGATRIALTACLSCQTVAAEQTCDSAPAADQEIMRSIQAEVAIWQAKDGEKIFFASSAKTAPFFTWLMYAPSDPEPKAFARDRGFGSARVLGDGWTILDALPMTLRNAVSGSRRSLEARHDATQT